MATWVWLGAVTTWARVFDFGAGTSTYLFLTPRGSAGGAEHLGMVLPKYRAPHTPGETQWRVGIDFGTSGADDLIGGAEDFLGALFGDRFRVKTVPSAQPILNISSAKLCPFKTQRFTTKKRHGFRFDLAQTARRGISVGELCLGCVA